MKKAAFYSTLLFCIALIMSSCAKEPLYLSDEDSADPFMEKSAVPDLLLDALARNINGYTEFSAFSGKETGIPYAGRSFSTLNANGFSDGVYISAADFSDFPGKFLQFSGGHGLLQGSSQVSERFGLQPNSNTQFSDVWGFEIMQSSDMSALDLSSQFSPDASLAGEILQLSPSTNTTNFSYVAPLATTLQNVAGWEIWDNKNKVAMLMVSIDNRFGYVISASNQNGTNKVRSLVNEKLVNRIRNADPNNY